MPLTDEWFKQQRKEMAALNKQYGIKPKRYFSTKYNGYGELVEYQETEDSPCMVKLDGVWREQEAVSTSRKRKSRGTVTDHIRDTVIKRLNKNDRPSQIARDFDLSPATISKIKKEAADAGLLHEDIDNKRTSRGRKSK